MTNMPQTQPTENDWLDNILDDFGHKAVNGAERHGTNIETRKAILDGLQARGWKSPEEVKALEIQSKIDEWENIDGEGTYYWTYRYTGHRTEKVYLTPTERILELDAQLRHSAQRNPHDDTELREKLNGLYNEAIQLGRLRTGSPIDHMVNGVMQLIQQRDERREQAIQALKDIVIHAAPDGTQDDGDFVGFYVLPTGPVHRAIATLQNVGQSADTMGDVAVISRYQAHLAQLQQNAQETDDTKEGE